MKAIKILAWFVFCVILGYLLGYVLDTTTKIKPSRNSAEDNYLGIKANEITILQEKAISKEIYRLQVIKYCSNNEIFIDVNKIDSMYFEEEPEVQILLNQINKFN